uniref:Uncharacterized protein n=1 Tax=Kalanchoe fedtschenkoi TaxID=63787 RepID=A0A7N0RI03_KALFE
MATRRKAVSRSRIATRSSSIAKQPAKIDNDQEQQQLLEVATTGCQEASAISSTEQLCSPSPVKKSGGGRAEIRSDHIEDDGCCWSTPKAKRFRIPEMETCPPAPKKQRAAAEIGNCMLRRSSIPFFTPPELAEFFFRVSIPNMSSSAV